MQITIRAQISTHFLLYFFCITYLLSCGENGEIKSINENEATNKKPRSSEFLPSLKYDLKDLNDNILYPSISSDQSLLINSIRPGDIFSRKISHRHLLFFHPCDSLLVFTPGYSEEIFQKFINEYLILTGGRATVEKIVVDVPDHFNALLWKSSNGCSGNKPGYWNDDIFWNNNLSTYTGYQKIANGLIIQGSTKVPRQGSWDCGPNSGLRALYMMGFSWNDSYENFRSYCPKSIGYWGFLPNPH